MRAFAQFERELIRERQREELRLQKGKGSKPAEKAMVAPTRAVGAIFSERSLKPNYSAPLNKTEANSIGIILDNEMGRQLISGKHRKMFR